MTAPNVMMLARRVCNAHHERMMPGETMSMGYVDPVRVIRADAPELAGLVEAARRAERFLVSLGVLAGADMGENPVLRGLSDALSAWEAMK